MLENMKILVVDDEPEVKALYLQWYDEEIKAGIFEFSFVYSGEEALKFMEKGDASNVVLILSDINMPGMTGLELLRKLKEKNKELPVVMVSAYGDEQNYTLAKDYGADAFVNKPVDFDDLKNKLSQYDPEKG